MTGRCINDYGGQLWYKEGKLHREGDRPAVVLESGGKEWWKGKRHHEGDRSAKIYADGTQEW